MITEEQFLKEIEEQGFKDLSFNIEIPYLVFEDENKKEYVKIDFEDIRTRLKRVEQELLEITKQEY